MSIAFDKVNLFISRILPASHKHVDCRFSEISHLIISSEAKILARLGLVPEALSLEYNIAKTHDGVMLTLLSDKVIGGSLREFGTFQEKDVDRAVNFLIKLGFPFEGNTFLDIGANIGTHTIHALKTNFRNAICVEPDPENFKILRINQLLNEVDNKCINFNLALSDISANKTLELSPTNFGDHRVVGLTNATGENIHDEESWNKINIKSVTLDALLNENNIHESDISLIWIDTQGHEGHVLSGASKLMNSPVPIVIEFWPYGLNRSGGWMSLRNILVKSNKKIFDMKPTNNGEQIRELTIKELDVMYVDFLKSERKEKCAHTDLLLT
jgi:FkbM family methyltransferase